MGSVVACGRRAGARGARQSSHFTGLIQRKDSGVSFWMEGKQNAWERAKGGSTPRWTQIHAPSCGTITGTITSSSPSSCTKWGRRCPPGCGRSCRAPGSCCPPPAQQSLSGASPCSRRDLPQQYLAAVLEGTPGSRPPGADGCAKRLPKQQPDAAVPALSPLRLPRTHFSSILFFLFNPWACW